jgi:hypothetical protein
MNASDIAYIAALVEKAPSTYPRRKALVEELQRIYRMAQSGVGHDVYRVPVVPNFAEGGVMEVERG